MRYACNANEWLGYAPGYAYGARGWYSSYLYSGTPVTFIRAYDGYWMVWAQGQYFYVRWDYLSY